MARDAGIGSVDMCGEDEEVEPDLARLKVHPAKVEDSASDPVAERTVSRYEIEASDDLVRCSRDGGAVGRA